VISFPQLPPDLRSAAAWSRLYARLVSLALLSTFGAIFVLPAFLATMKAIADFSWGQDEQLAGSVNRDRDLEEEGQRFISEALVSGSWHVLVALLLVGYSTYRFVAIRIALRRVTRSGEFISVEASDLPNLNFLLNDLLSRMEIPEHRVALFWIDSSRLSPSIVKQRRKICLFIPSGFLVLLDSNTQAARAVLAHELGHIIVGDTQLWPFSVSTQTVLKKFSWGVVLPVMLASTAFPMLWDNRIGLIVLTWIVGLSFIAYRCSVAFVLWARCRSEQVADAIAVHFVGKIPFAEAVQSVTAEVHSSSIHLSKQQRLEFISLLD
jgi:hypothetical protein